MIKQWKNFIETGLPGYKIWLATLFAFVLNQASMIWLDASYARSQYPVPFFKGQLTFNATELKGYYQFMLEHGTMEIYWQTQMIDFLFIVTGFIFYTLLLMVASRLIQSNAKLYRIAIILALILPHSATMDAIENAISFILLSNPLNFADWLVYPYSSFAALKFTLIVLAALWFVFTIFAALYLKLPQRNKLKVSAN